MSIADKLVTVAENVPKVYEAGKNSIVKLHPETTISGKCISVDDVSELPHGVGCQLSSDTVTDFSGVTVTRCGKNLLNPNAIKSILAAEGTKRNGWEFVGLVGTFTLSVGANWIQQKPLVYKVISADGVFGYGFTLDGRETQRKKIITLNEGERLIVYLYSSETAPNDTIQLESGGHMMEHEPYNGEMYTSKADGTVEGIKSTSPYMNLFTNTDGVNIQATYRKNTRYRDGKKAQYDTFWDEYQQNGNKKSYTGAFAGEGWNNANFKPKYTFGSPTNCAYMFYSSGFVGDLAQYLEDSGITLDTSKATNMSGFANTARYVTRFGVIDATSTNTSNSGGIFSFCYELKKVDKFIVSELTSLSNSFSSCQNLIDITIEGTIGQNANFKDSPLNKASILSIINALSTTATNKTLTLKLSAVNTAFETSEGANDGSTSVEWAALIATKPNWTISMIE